MSSYFVGYTIGQIPWGLLADRFGSRRVIATSIFGSASSTLFFSVASGFWQAIVARFFSGLLGAGVFVPGVRLVSDWFTSDRRGTALGLLSVGGSLGLITSSWVIPASSAYLGWRGTMTVIGILGLASVAVIWRALKDRAVEKAPRGSRSDFVGVFRTRNFWIMACVQFVRLGSNYTFIAWLPLMLREEYGLSLVAAGAVYSLFNLAGMISNPVGGIVSDRIGEPVVLLTTFSALSVFTYLFIGLKSQIFMYLIIIAMGGCINFLRSPSFAILPKLYGVERAGRISGIHNTFASAGALCLPLLLGYIVDATSSYFAGWILLSIIFLLASILMLVVKVSLGETPIAKT
jgi:nitrate/nitrite transporter NarK